MPDIWWQIEDPVARAAQLTKTIDSIEHYQYSRIARARANISMYENRKLAGLHPACYLADVAESSYRGDQYDALRMNMARSVVNTAHAQIAGKQKPKVQFCVSDSDWKTKRQAKKLERFVEAVQMGRQGRYHDAWDVGISAMRDCCITDAGVLKVWGDRDEKRIRIERRYSWEVFHDPAELKYGSPQNIFDVYGYDRDNLAARYPEHRERIMAAPSLASDSRGQEDNYTYGTEAARQIKIREAIRLPLDEDHPGRWTIAAGGIDLIDEEWTRRDFPYLWMLWEPWVVEGYGTSLVDNVYHLNEEVNASVQRWSDAERLVSNAMIVYEEGSCDPSSLDSNEIGIKVSHKPGTPPPQVTAPNAVSQASIEWLAKVTQACFELSGVSSSSATAQREPGLPSAAAQRVVADKGSERFAIPWQMYERVMAVGLTRQILACAKELAEDDPSFAATWVHDGHAQELRWSDVNVDLPDEAIQVWAVSGLINSPADRLELASELFDRRLITNEAFLEVIQAKSISAELERTNETTRWLERQMETWLDYEDGDENDPDSGFIYKPPPKFIGMDALAQVVITVARAYLREDTDGCPPEKLAWFTRFMSDTDRIVQQLQQAQAQLQAAAAGKGPLLAPGVPSGAAPELPNAGPPGPPMPQPGAQPGEVMQ